MHQFLRSVLLGTVLLGGLGCSEYHDPALKMSKDQYEKILTGQEEFANPPPKPLARPSANQYQTPSKMQRRISVAITPEVPLKEVFMEMAQQARINIAVDPKVKGGILYQSHDQPFFEVVEEICDAAGLRFRLEKNTIHIDPDAPYAVNYNVQFLNLSRQNKNRISMATDVFTAMEGYSRDFDNGSSTLLTGESTINFWEELEANLKSIINYPLQEPMEYVPSYSIHKHAGLVSVFATQKRHKQIAKYLQLLQKSAHTQVLIEAKIVEVNLNKEFQSGINWHAISNDFKLMAPLGDIAIPGAFNPNREIPKNIFTLGGSGKSLTALASLLNRFGTVRTLSSPRLTVMNNQSAVLKVATNFVFFKINYSRDIRENNLPDVERASSQIQTVPIGLVMVVQPTIDSDSGHITMNIRPTISRVVEEKEDPAVAILSKQQTISKIPVVQVREIDSVLQLYSGDVIVMGGLMEDRSDNNHSGLTELEDMPFLEGLFGGRENKRSINELVIFLRATIVDGPIIGGADRNVYQQFTQDSRPLQFKSDG